MLKLCIISSSALLRSRVLRSEGISEIPKHGFITRRTYLCQAFDKHAYLKNPDSVGQQPNPLSDPSSMDTMMDGMKKNMAMIIPQTLIMSWITFFFSGFVLLKLPFPLTLRFKAMLQRGIETADMDVSWVSSLSWYFLNLFGLKSIFTIILGQDNAADGMRDMQQMQMNPAMGAGAPPDQSGVFKSEKEFMELAVHEFRLDDIETKILESYGVLAESKDSKKKK
ncbi:ER membrane complex subunit 3 [Blyttiomyces sp. JEL0837]|nr:ER membrane complex subunit 3 [Blyttiomyces sp. JEL0837]